MSRINIAWIVLIVFCSIVIVSSIFYLLYRLYIDRIYKRKRAWNDLRYSLNPIVDEQIEPENISLTPRESIISVVHAYVPSIFQKKKTQRTMATQLQFIDAPKSIVDFTNQWEEFDKRSQHSNSTSYYSLSPISSFDSDGEDSFSSKVDATY